MRRIRFVLGLAAIVMSAAFASNAGSASTNLSINLRVLGTDGQACKAWVCFWQAVEAGGQLEPVDYFRDKSERAAHWHDRVTGKTWRPIQSCGVGEGGTTKDKLTPGDYRVTAFQGDGPTPFGISEVIHLDRTMPNTKVVLRLQGGPELTVSAADAQTQKPIALFQAMLVRDDGFPVATHGSNWPLWSREQEARLNFHQLPPGTYRLEAYRPAFNAEEPEYLPENGPLEIRVVAGVDQHITARLKAVALPEEVVRQRWPYVATGRVTDERGQGLEGVAIGASCGFATMLPSGATTSGADGRYTLRFHGDTRAGKGALQPAMIGPDKAGYVEANLARQGNLLMAGQMPELGELTRRKSDSTKVILPERPFALDFVMIPAATLKGQLVDAQGCPMIRQRIYLCGNELPPGAEVLGQVHTDAEGRFQFNNVPPRRAWWFRSPDNANARSRPVTVEQPLVQSVSLRFARQEGKPVLELADRDDDRGTAVNLAQPSTNAAASSKLVGAIVGTTWQWDATDERITFSEDGVIRHPGWEERGLATSWQAIDEHTVLLTIEKGRRADRYAVLVFNTEFTEYAGHNFHGAGKIAPSKQVRD